jgi:UDP-N-acetylmuramyl pentapeptide synthase
LLGEHWTPAVLAAMGAALSLGVAMKEIIARLACIDPPEGRYSTEYLPNGVTMICDDFKSPMHSIQPALAFLQTARSTRKIVVIGHISDHSNSSSHGYKRVASKAVAVCDKVLFINRFASQRLVTLSRRHRERVHCFDHLEEVKDFLADDLRPGDLVLLKGIRKMDHFERLVMAFHEGVACWELKCGIQAPCGQCPRCDRAAP